MTDPIKGTETNCPICGAERTVEIFNESNNVTTYICEYCGNFTLGNECCGFNDSNRHLIAGYLYEMKEAHVLGKEKINHFNKENTKKLLESSVIPKTSMQRLDKFLLNIYKNGKDFNSMILPSNILPQMAYAKDRNELFWMANALCDLGYLHKFDDRAAYVITIKGLQHAESLLTDNSFSTKVFIAMKFSDNKDKIRDEGIKPACDACGFKAFTVDEEEHNGDITDKIIYGIKTSRFIIADFTENNLGVYYEAGYAKELGIPVIKICNEEWFEKKDENGNKVNKLHFDVEHDNMILWKDEKDLAKKLESRIKATTL